MFCESGYFTVAETEQIMEAGIKFGLHPKIHVNQFNSIEEFNQGEIQCIICRSS
jgi:imidazolonepropionase